MSSMPDASRFEEQSERDLRQLRQDTKPGKKPNGADIKEPWTPRSFTASSLLTNPPKPPEWIVKGLLPVGLAYLAGRPKTGKSLLAGQIMRAVTVTEGSLFDLEVRHGPGLYIDVENSRWRLYDRMRKAGMLLGEGSDRMHFVTEWQPGNRTGFLRLVDQHKPVFAVIDIWAKFRAARYRDQDQYEFESAELSWLHATANERDMCILCVGHRTKFEDPDDPFINFAGSTAIIAGVDTMLAFSKVPGNTCQRQLQLRGRDTGDESWILRIDEKLNCSKVCDGDQFVTPAHTRYLKLMAEKPTNAWTASELATKAEVTPQAVTKSFVILRDRGLIEPGIGGGSVLTGSGLLVASTK
jgi:hypothetical protein